MYFSRAGRTRCEPHSAFRNFQWLAACIASGRYSLLRVNDWCTISRLNVEKRIDGFTMGWTIDTDRQPKGQTVKAFDWLDYNVQQEGRVGMKKALGMLSA